MSNTPIELKGSSFTLSVVHLHEAEPKVIHQALEDKIAQAPAFLKHAPVVLNVSALEDPVNWSAMHKAVSATGLRVIGVSGCKDAQLKAEIEKMGLPILTEGKEKAPRPVPRTTGSSAKYNAGHKNAFNRYPGAFRSAYLCSTM